MKIASLLTIVASTAFAQQPQIENAKFEMQTFSGPLSTQLARLGAGPYWAGYEEPIGRGRHSDMCGSNQSSNAPVRLEGQTAIVVLVRIAGAKVDEIRITSPDCRLDAGELPFYWFENVPPEASITWLKANIPGSSHPDQAIMAIALHASPAADDALAELAAPTQPERIREKTAFWLGSARGSGGVEALNRMLSSDPSLKVREQVVFALSQSKDPKGIASVLNAARSDKDPQIRSRALFWLARKASREQALDTIRASVKDDPERSVREQAVFALKQLPEDQGTPALIDVARNHADPLIRKKAMFWLGQSKDPRAIDFFAGILKQ